MNEHIKEYCEQFIESQSKPEFALFIKGKWGVGKTYFINELLEKYSKKNKENNSKVTDKNIIKISLFGVKSTEEIDLKIYQAIHPILSSKEMKLLGGFVRTALKCGSNIDFNNDGKTDLAITLNGTNSKKNKKIKLNEIEKKLLVVDDFERAILSPNEIFGYFSEIISDSEVKVIFIGNEEKIFNKDTEKKNEYLRIKEKTIGMEFQVKPEFENAISQFIEEIKFEEYNEKIKKIIQEISHNLECDNLRTIRQSLYNLKLIFNLFISFDDKDLEKGIIIFLILFIQKNLKMIDESIEIPRILNIYFENKMSYQKYKNLNPDVDNLFSFSWINGYIPVLSHWKSIIFDGNYRIESLKLAYQDEKNQQLEKTKKTLNSLFVMLNDWQEMDKEQFTETLNDLKKEIDMGKYLHPGEILLYANIKIIFSKWKLIPDTDEEIFNEIVICLEKNNDKIIIVEYWEVLSSDFGGFGFNRENPGFEKIYQKMKLYNQNKLNERMKININDEIDLLSTDATTFCKNIIHAGGNNKYYNQPILSYLNIEIFYEKLKTQPINTQEMIIEALEERYGKKYSNGTVLKGYYPDCEYLKKLYQMYDQEDEDFSYNPIAMFRHRIKERLHELVQYFELNISTSNLET